MNPNYKQIKFAFSDESEYAPLNHVLSYGETKSSLQLIQVHTMKNSSNLPSKPPCDHVRPTSMRSCLQEKSHQVLFKVRSPRTLIRNNSNEKSELEVDQLPVREKKKKNKCCEGLGLTNKTKNWNPLREICNQKKKTNCSQQENQASLLKGRSTQKSDKWEAILERPGKFVNWSNY